MNMIEISILLMILFLHLIFKVVVKLKVIEIKITFK